MKSQVKKRDLLESTGLVRFMAGWASRALVSGSVGGETWRGREGVGYRMRAPSLPSRSAMSAAVEVAEVAEGIVVAKDMDLSCTRCV